MTDFTVEATAKGGGMYRLYVDGVEVSQHTAEREAMQEGLNHLAQDIDRKVHYEHEYSVVIGPGVGIGAGTVGQVRRAKVEIVPTETLEPENPGQITDLAHDTGSLVTFTVPDDGTGNPANVAIRYTSTPPISWGPAGGTEVEITDTGTVGIGGTYSYDSGLTVEDTYEFQCVAFRGTQGVDPTYGALSNVATVVITGGAEPLVSGSLSLFSTGPTSLGWTLGAASGGDTSGDGYSYQLYGSTTSPVVIPDDVLSGQTGLSGEITGLTESVEFFVVARVTDDAAATDDSAEVSATPTSSTPIFSDSFATGDLSHTANGFGWSVGRASVVASGSMQDGAIPHTGSYALEFAFPGSNGPANVSQHFELGGSGYAEVWMEYWIRFPTNYVHQDGEQTAADNNKFLRLWGGEYGTEGRVGVGAELYRAQPGTDSHLIMQANRYGSAVIYNTNTYLSGGFIGNAVKDGGSYFTHGAWHRFRFHYRIHETLAEMEVWIDATKVMDEGPADLELWATTSPMINVFERGYLLGPASSRFADPTYFYIDDVKFYDSDPGW